MPPACQLTAAGQGQQTYGERAMSRPDEMGGPCGKLLHWSVSRPNDRNKYTIITRFLFPPVPGCLPARALPKSCLEGEGAVRRANGSQSPCPARSRCRPGGWGPRPPPWCPSPRPRRLPRGRACRRHPPPPLPPRPRRRPGQRRRRAWKSRCRRSRRL